MLCQVYAEILFLTYLPLSFVDIFKYHPFVLSNTIQRPTDTVTEFVTCVFLLFFGSQGYLYEDAMHKDKLFLENKKTF